MYFSHNYINAVLLTFVIHLAMLWTSLEGLSLDGSALVSCNEKSTLPGYGLLVTHAPPSAASGTVSIKSVFNDTLLSVSFLTWKYKVQGFSIEKIMRTGNNSNLNWHFAKIGLHKVEVVVKFRRHSSHEEYEMSNCTYVNVTDCLLMPIVQVSTLNGVSNVSENDTKVSFDAPGFANLTVLLMRTTDPYFVCKRLAYSWNFNDGSHFSGMHVTQYYNKSGYFSVNLNVYKVFEFEKNRQLVTNFSLTLHVKEAEKKPNGSDTAIDVTLVLSIFIVCFVFVICVTAYFFRQRYHRHTEVAAFDFRPFELQTSVNGHHCHSYSNYRSRIRSLVSCRSATKEQLLDDDFHRYSYGACSG